MDTQFYIYILLCENHAFYTGYTKDLNKRITDHFSGKSRCKYTRSFKPVDIVGCWSTKDKKSALQVERYIKTLTRSQKEILIAEPERLTQQFSVAVYILERRLP